MNDVINKIEERKRSVVLKPYNGMYPWDVIGCIAKYINAFGRVCEYKVYGWLLNSNGNFVTHSTGVQQSFFEDTIYCCKAEEEIK